MVSKKYCDKIIIKKYNKQPMGCDAQLTSEEMSGDKCLGDLSGGTTGGEMFRSLCRITSLYMQQL